MNEHTQWCEILISTDHVEPARTLVLSEKKLSKVFHMFQHYDINITITVNNYSNKVI